MSGTQNDRLATAVTSNGKAASGQDQDPALTVGREKFELAMKRIERAQNLIDLATADLSSILGGVKIWRETSALGDKVKNHWYRVESAYNTMLSRGGPRVDESTVEFERQRSAAKESQP